jgi:hypothetical protein
VAAVWEVYWVEREGWSMDRRKMDLLDYYGGSVSMERSLGVQIESGRTDGVG